MIFTGAFSAKRNQHDSQTESLSLRDRLRERRIYRLENLFLEATIEIVQTALRKGRSVTSVERAPPLRNSRLTGLRFIFMKSEFMGLQQKSGCEEKRKRKKRNERRLKQKDRIYGTFGIAMACLEAS